jgi:UDP-N-acetylglucosamine 2-epimerase (non-hydrolysing)/GDP/UDP-N,N'-diacetylbacillosamine 2-epimerase (hydrolysing)
MKILALTSIRSDYDLLSSLYKLLNQDPNIDFRLLVSGAHMSSAYGSTVNVIRDDGFEILMELETLIDADSVKSKLKTASIFLQNSIDIVAKFAPDLILYAGDREDVIMGGLLGTYLKIPTVHFYGGDHEQGGHEDTVIRHATSKLSTHHFVSCEEHRQRLIKIGEKKDRIFNIGSISLDRFKEFKPLTADKISEELQIDEINNFALVIYHPSPSDEDDDTVAFENILQVLKSQNIFSFVSFPNTDSNSSKIVDVINRYQNRSGYYFFKNLEREVFLSIFKQCRFLIGNSSAGIYEAASVPIPAINVGARQKERMHGDNVLFCETTTESIEKTVLKASSQDFLDSIKDIENVYGDGQSAQRAYKLIKNLDFIKLFHKTEDPLCS